MESMWNVMDSILGVCGIHVECHGIHGRCVWNPWDNVWNPWGNVWNPCDDLWNRTIPPGIHLECGGRVNYWNTGASMGLPEPYPQVFWMPQPKPAPTKIFPMDHLDLQVK